MARVVRIGIPLLRRLLWDLRGRIAVDMMDVGRAAEAPLRGTSSRITRGTDHTETTHAALARGFDRDDPAGEAGDRVPDAAEATNRDAPLVVADELHRLHLSGATATWANFLPRFIPQREFEAWILEKTEGPLPRLSPDSAFNCREMILWAAANTGVLTHAQLRRQYAPLLGRRARRRRNEGILPETFGHWIQRATLPHGTSDYDRHDPDGARPRRGDLIVWDGWNEGNAHTAMATGRLIGPERDAEVYSFWPPPTAPDIPGTRTAAVQITTVGRLTPYIDVPGVPPGPILFGRGPW